MNVECIVSGNVLLNEVRERHPDRREGTLLGVVYIPAPRKDVSFVNMTFVTAGA